MMNLTQLAKERMSHARILLKRRFDEIKMNILLFNNLLRLKIFKIWKIILRIRFDQLTWIPTPIPNTSENSYVDFHSTYGQEPGDKHFPCVLILWRNQTLDYWKDVLFACSQDYYTHKKILAYCKSREILWWPLVLLWNKLRRVAILIWTY